MERRRWRAKVLVIVAVEAGKQRRRRIGKEKDVKIDG